MIGPIIMVRRWLMARYDRLLCKILVNPENADSLRLRIKAVKFLMWLTGTKIGVEYRSET